MECPNCNHEASPAALLKCSHCGKVYERQFLEEYEHIGYLIEWLEKHRGQLGDNVSGLEQELVNRETELVRLMHIEEIPVEAAKPAPAAPVPAPVVPPVATPAPAPVALQAPKPVPVVVSAPLPQAVPAPKPAPQPAPVPSKPAKPPIEWGKVWDSAVNFVVSGALLRALLYMGAFMIVISMAVLVISFWNSFHPYLRVAFVFAVPAVCYAGGWLIRTRMKLVQAGRVITGVGALLVAVDFAAIYQLAQLNVDINLYWLFAALMTTFLYIFTAYRIEGEFFDYLMLLAGVNVLVALTRVLNTSLEWTFAAIPFAGAGMAGLAIRLWPRGAAWRDTARAARYLPQVIIPIGLIAALLAGGSHPQAGSVMAFLCAAIGYGLLAWKFPSVWQFGAALVGLTAAIGLGVWIVDPSAVWLGSAGALLSAVYILVGWRFFGKENPFERQASYRMSLYAIGFFLCLPVLASSLAMALMGKTLEAAIPLTLLSLSFCAWSLLLRQPVFGFFGAGLLFVPFGMWLHMAGVKLDFFPLAYLLLISFAHLPAAILIGRVDKKYAAPFNLTGWLASLLIFFVAFPTGWFPPSAFSGVTLSLLTVYYAFTTWHFRSSFFAWAAAVVLPFAIWQWLRDWALPLEQAALAWVGLAFIYMLVERLFNGRKEQVWAGRSFRTPFALGAILLAGVGWLASLIAYTELYLDLQRAFYPLAAQVMVVLLTILAARLYRSRIPLFVQVFLSAVLSALFYVTYGASLFGRSLEWYQFGLVFGGLAWLHLLAAIVLDRRPTRYAHALYTGAYGLAAVAVVWTVVDRLSLLWTLGSLIVMMSASAALVEFKVHRTWDDFTRLFDAPGSVAARVDRGAFLWAAAWSFPVWCSLLLIQLEVSMAFRWLAFSLPALVYLPLGRLLSKRDSSYAWPFSSAAHVFTLVALLFSVDHALAASAYVVSAQPIPAIDAGNLQILIGQTLVQLATLVFYTAWAWMKRQHFFAHVASWVSILLFTSVMLAIMQTITIQTLVIAWAAWAALLLMTGFWLDRLPQGSARHAHGPYFAGYMLAVFALLASLQERGLTIIVLGLFILFAIASAVAVHYRQHHTWDDFARLFGAPDLLPARLARSAFLWPIAWLFPLWCGLVLIHLDVQISFRWLALGVPALLYIILGAQLAKRESVYSWPFSAAAHTFALVALLFSVDRALVAGQGVVWGLSPLHINTSNLSDVIGQGLVQLAVVAFYATWAGMKHQRFFAYVAAGLSVLPFTSFLVSLAGMTAQSVVIGWAAWAAVLMLVGFLLDRLKDAPRHAHGPTLVGYALAIFALLVSIQDRWLNIIVLGICILLAAWASLALHFQRQGTWDDFVNFFWRSDTLVKRGARLLPLFFAAYALPIWLVQLETYYHLSLAWQGVSLALLAPLYIACGLALRGANPDYTWPVYSAGYALTALGAMIAFDDQRLAIYVLMLDIVVYAVSSVIFRQPFWLYLATFLTPITMLITLQYNALFTLEWVAWSFTALGLLYFGLGQLIERRKPEMDGVAPFAMPLYAPGYLLSAIALALASGDRSLALGVYPANIALFGLSAWRFREPLFLYPAAWLSIVPYYLFVIPTFAVPFEWQGVAWLPLILVLIGLGRFVFHKRALDLKTPRAILDSFSHPALPFYSIAYALTINMILGSRWTPTALTAALVIATALYLASALLFRHPAWLYPTLFTAHFSILAYFSINPSDGPARYVTLPFLILTWLEALAGYFVSRRYPVTEMATNGKLVFKFFGREFDFGSYPSVGYLTVPSWAQPIFVVVTLDTLLWESTALGGLDTGLWVSTGFFLLLALFATLWQDKLLAHISLGLGVLAAGYQMYALGFSGPQIFANLGGIALALYLLSWLAEWRKGVLDVWRRPPANLAILLSAISLMVALPYVLADRLAAALALGFSGALYLTIFLRRRTYLLGYFGMGSLLAAWSLFLFFVRNVEQPQFYAIPAGLYFIAMGFFERRRRPGRFALLIESLGLAFLLVTSLIQSVDGVTGFPYFLLLLVEAGLVVWWGAARRLRVPFVIGIIAIVVNFLAQLVVRFHDANPWIVGLVVGVLFLGLGIIIERRREALLARAQELRDRLEGWD